MSSSNPCLKQGIQTRDRSIEIAAIPSFPSFLKANQIRGDDDLLGVGGQSTTLITFIYLSMAGAGYRPSVGCRYMQVIFSVGSCFRY